MTLTDDGFLRKLQELKECISDSSTLFKATFGSVLSQEPSTAPVELFPPLQLVVPPSFYDQLSGLSSYRLGQVNSAVQGLIEDYTHTFEKTSQDLASMATAPKLRSTIIDQVRQGFQDHFETRALSSLAKKVTNFLAQNPPPSQPLPTPGATYEPARPFNNEYTPILLTYFNYDAYPSSQDKQTIAELSGMTWRQIDVWFQNHRRMAKQTGAPILRKRHASAVVPQGLQISFSTSAAAATEQQKEKQRMLGLFKFDPATAAAAINSIGSGAGVNGVATTKDAANAKDIQMLDVADVLIPGVGAGTGASRADPIQIEDGVVFMNDIDHPAAYGVRPESHTHTHPHSHPRTHTRTRSKPNNSNQVLSSVEIVERRILEEEERARQERLDEEKGFLSLMRPRWSGKGVCVSSDTSFACSVSSGSASMSTTTQSSSGHLTSFETAMPTDADADILSPSASPSSFPASYTKTSYFRDASSSSVRHIPLFPSPVWVRVAPSSQTSPSSSTSAPSSSTSAPASSSSPSPSLSSIPQFALLRSLELGILPDSTSSSSSSTQKKKKLSGRASTNARLALERAERDAALEQEKRDDEFAMQMRALNISMTSEERERETREREREEREKAREARDALYKRKYPNSSMYSSASASGRRLRGLSLGKRIKETIERNTGTRRGVEAATCVYTYVLPRAPFWACVKQQVSDDASSSSSATFAPLAPAARASSAAPASVPSPSSQSRSRSRSSTPSTPPTTTRKSKPAALGPRRRPAHAPSSPSSSTSSSTPSTALPSSTPSSSALFTAFSDIPPAALNIPLAQSATNTNTDMHMDMNTDADGESSGLLQRHASLDSITSSSSSSSGSGSRSASDSSSSSGSDSDSGSGPHTPPMGVPVGLPLVAPVSTSHSHNQNQTQSESTNDFSALESLANFATSTFEAYGVDMPSFVSAAPSAYTLPYAFGHPATVDMDGSVRNAPTGTGIGIDMSGTSATPGFDFGFGGNLGMGMGAPNMNMFAFGTH